MNPTIAVGDRRYPLAGSVTIAVPRPLSLHPEGTPELPCCLCGVALPVDDRTRAFRTFDGLRVACVRCAYRAWPDMVAAAVGPRPVTLREVVDGNGLRREVCDWARGQGPEPEETRP
jgi:hypothetical protein